MHSHMNQYDNLGRIGEGTYGVVLKCRHKPSGELVAIKKFKECDDDDEQVRKTALREVKLLQTVRHDNIVRLLEVFQHQRKLHLVFEYVEGTVLQELERLPRGLGDPATRRIMWQLVRATEHLHSLQIVHRDIKPENMLLFGSGLLKLCDFGFARYLSAPQNAGDMSDYVATRWYRAPELLVGDRSYGSGVDVWAIGCMVVEMQTGQALFPGTSDLDQLWLILKSFTPDQLEEVCHLPYFQHIQIPKPHECEPLDTRFPFLDVDVLDFLKACLHPVPAKRRACYELLQMPYFYGANTWFGRNFGAPEAKKLARQAMSVERVRKQRRYKRKADARCRPFAEALNISPYRERNLMEMGSRAASPVDSSPMQTDGTPEPTAALRSNPTDAQAKCNITFPQEMKLKANTISLEVKTDPSPANTNGTDECMTDAPGMPTFHPDTNREIDSIPMMGPKRSQRRQPGHAEWVLLPQSMQGVEQRHGSQFASPDPRLAKSKGQRQHVNYAARNPHTERQGHLAGSHQQSLMKSQCMGQEPRRHEGPVRGRGRGRLPASERIFPPERASKPHISWDYDDSRLQGIAALHGPEHHSNENRVGPPQWLAKWGQPLATSPLRMPEHHRKSPHRWVSPSLMVSRSQSLAAEPGPGLCRSPLRAHAPAFVPSSLQALKGTRVELHPQHSHDT